MGGVHATIDAEIIMPAPAQHQHKILRPIRSKRQKHTSPLLASFAYFGAAVAMVVLALIFKENSIDTWLVVLYGLSAVVMRVPSEDSFKLALIALVGVPIFTMLQMTNLTDNFAQYAFLLLCIGTISALIEQLIHKPQHKK